MAQQSGAALLLMLLVVVALGGTFGLQALNLAASTGGVENPATTKVLAEAKESLLAWAQNVDRITNGGYRAIRPGALPYPDVYGQATNLNPIVYDGMQDQGCIRTNWSGANNLRLPTAGNAANMRCLGKLPWRLLGLNLSQRGTLDGAGAAIDSSGAVPWYAVSANLVNHVQTSSVPCPRRFDALIAASTTTTAGCGASETGTPTLPFPWISVRDPVGNLLSNRVAAVVIMPGPPIPRQTGTLTQNNRATITAATGRADQFLDTVRNSQCVPTGYCDNARFTTAALEFIQCVPPSTTLNDSRFTQPYTCNDRLVYITIDELMQAASDRVAREATACLNAFARSQRRAPFAATLASARDAVLNVNTGFIPTGDWNESVGVADDWSSFCSYFGEAEWDSWQQLFNYRVSPGRAQSEGWSAPADITIAGKAGRYKVELWVDINGTRRYYGIP